MTGCETIGSVDTPASQIGGGMSLAHGGPDGSGDASPQEHGLRSGPTMQVLYEIAWSPPRRKRAGSVQVDLGGHA